MRFLADQNVEELIVIRLRGAGFDVLRLAEVLPVRAIDDEVLYQAREQARILLTNDKDFGELTFLQGKAAAGVVLLRMPSFDSHRKAELARRGDLVAEERTVFGIKYVIDGSLNTPTGRRVGLRTVWISDGLDDAPRLVTAYPRRGAS